MVSLYMGHLSWEGVPADEKVVRATADVYRMDKPPAVAEDMPVQQELEFDPDPALGLASRQKASAWHQGVRAVPSWSWESDVTPSFALINGQQAKLGTAAAREDSGVVNPNASYAVGIEPVGDLADGNHKMGNDYFVRHERGVQDTADNTMMSVPPDYYHQNYASVIASGQTKARDSGSAGLYDAFWNGGK